MSESERPAGHWQRSSYCADGSCAEVSTGPDEILLRASGRPGVVLRFTRDEWALFVSAVRDGGFTGPG